MTDGPRGPWSLREIMAYQDSLVALPELIREGERPFVPNRVSGGGSILNDLSHFGYGWSPWGRNRRRGPSEGAGGHESPQEG